MSMDAQTTILLWALILPMIGAVGVVAFGRWPNLRDSWTIAIGLSTFGCVARLVGPVMDGARPSLPLPSWMPGLGLGFEVEPLGLLFGLVASGLWILTSLYGFGYNDTPDAPSHAVDTVDAAGETVPEPSSVALFALGAAGLSMLRRRK